MLIDLETLYVMLEYLVNIQFLTNCSSEINIFFERIVEIISSRQLKTEYFSKLINPSSKKCYYKIPIVLNKEPATQTVQKIMENIFKKLKKLDLPFNDQYLILNIFKYLSYLLSEVCEIFAFSYAKYLFKLLKYSYISKELARAKHYCKCLERFKEKLKHPGSFSLWKAKIEFKSGNYMEAIKVLKNTQKILVLCRLKLFKYYLRSEFYSKNYVIMMFQGFLKELLY